MEILREPFVVLTDAALVASQNVDVEIARRASGFKLFLDLINNSGTTPTLDISFEQQGPQGLYRTIPGAVLAQVTTVTVNTVLVMFPGLASEANTKVNDVLGGSRLRVVFTLGGAAPNYNVDVRGYWL